MTNSKNNGSKYPTQNRIKATYRSQLSIAPNYQSKKSVSIMTPAQSLPDSSCKHDSR